MNPLRKLLVSAIVIALSGIFAPALVSGADATAAVPANPTFRQFDNGRLRIGSGTGEASVTATGLLRGPQYRSPDGNWYYLTINNNTLDSALGVGGDGTATWNLNGAISEGSVSNVNHDYSEFVATEARGGGAIGYGSITSTGTTTINGIQLRVAHRYTLGQNSGFIRVTTTVTNLSANIATNIRTWVGTRDDWIGNSDHSFKQRGSLSSTEFVPSTNSAERSPAIKIFTGSEGALFYSTSPKANTQIAGCCSFSNAYRSNPATNSVELSGDGSYALFVRLDDLATDQSESFTWYYAAGEISTLTETISEVAQAAASWTDQAVLDVTELGQAYSDSVTASGAGDITYSVHSGSLPTGISLDGSHGVISGMPTSTGTYTFVIRATAVSGGTTATSDSPELTILVGQRPTFLDNSVVSSAAAHIPLSDGVSASGFPAPAYRISGGALPTGLTIDTETGAITGTPTVRGTSNFSVTATNALGSIETPNLSFAVTAAPRITSTDGIPRLVTQASVFTGSASIAETVDGYTVSSGTLPPGVLLNGATGMMSGTATINGIYSFILRAANGDGFDDSELITVTVGEAPYASDSTLAQSGYAGLVFVDGISASGYPLPTYSVSAGALPDGITLNESTGEITGTATAPGTYSFDVTASNVFGEMLVGNYTLQINDTPRWSDQRISLSVLKGTRYVDSVTVIATPGPSYSVASGVMPAGLTLNTATGEISGVPSRAGQYRFSVAASSNEYRLVTPEFMFTVEQAPVWSDRTVQDRVDLGTRYADAVTATAWPLARYAIVSGALPAGLTLNPVTGLIDGAPTSSGEHTFTIRATNSHGVADTSLRISALEAPTQLVVDIPRTAALESVTGVITAEGFPAPTFSVATGQLPPGLQLNSTTGTITGTPTNSGAFTFTIAAINEAGETVSAPITMTVEDGATAALTNFAFEVPVGVPVSGAPVVIESSGLKPGAVFDVTVRSTPQIVADGTVNELGEIGTTIEIPGNLEAGWHSITVASTSATGEPSTEVIYFEVTDSLVLETISETPPTPAEEAAALTDDAEFYEAQGIDVATIVTPAVVDQQVSQVATVVASVALVSAVAGAAGAAAAAGGAGSAGSSGRASGARAAGSNSTAASSGSQSDDAQESEESEADYGNLEADHDDFEHDSHAWGDRLGLWKNRWATVLDYVGAHWTEVTSQVSPVLSRIINDGSYLRAMLGSITVFPYLIVIVLGVLAVDGAASDMASSALVAPVIVILVWGVLDAFGGLLGVTALVITTLTAHPVEGLGDVRYLLSMLILGFAPVIMATTFRKIRRAPASGAADVWERVSDVALIAFIASLTTLSLVSGVPAFAGASVPLADSATTIVAWVTGAAIVRIGLEELAAAAFSGRLDHVNPTEVTGPGRVQQWLSLALKYAVLALMIGDMVGWGWHLWVGSVIIFLPGILGLVLPELPKSRILTQLIPGGLAALLVATLIGNWSSEAVSSLFGSLPNYGELSFLLIPLPVIVLAIVGMFAADGDKWYRVRGLIAVYVVGGIAVFAVTVWITDFWGTIFGA